MESMDAPESADPETSAAGDETRAIDGEATTTAEVAATDKGVATEEATAVHETGAAGLSWGKVAVLGAALAFLGGAVGFVLTRDQPPSADSADVGFVQDMLTHHDQALGVARLTAAYGEDPIVRDYALDVITFQQFEIGVMTQMLAQWGYTREDRSDEAMAWMDMGVPVEFMPGLLTEEQLDEIGEARGRELDRLFLERMAEHHRGGLHMAQEGAARAQDDDVADLAARIQRNQAGEINEYRATAEEGGYGLDIAPASVPPADLPPTGDD
jgi:uncharacterized protein (DUF305 family)